MTDTSDADKDMAEARALAAAALKAAVERLDERLAAEDSTEVLIKGVAALHRVAEAPKDERRSNLPVFNISFSMGGVVAQPVQIVEEVAPAPVIDVTPEPAPLPQPDQAVFDIDALLSSINLPAPVHNDDVDL